MGMISPVWEETQEELEHPLTRITLHLHNTGEEEMPANTRGIIEDQFKELQETVFLFMKNLRKIQISFYDDNGRNVLSTAYSIDRPCPNYAVLTKVPKRALTSDEITKKHVKCFHVTTYQAKGLARNENRTYSEREESTKAYSNSQVVFAFPLSEKNDPVIKPQDIFVFLPVRATEFSFLIQADFVTDASRQDIVKDSPRNIGLRDAIACAFVKAVSQFCKTAMLRYQWIWYLPNRKDKNMERFWRFLTEKIAHCLSKEPVLFCNKMNDLHLIRDLVFLQDEHYLNDEPLFDDGDTEQMISQRYTKADLKNMQFYGLRPPSFEEINEWVRQDLRDRRLSRMKSPLIMDRWHTQAARLLQLLFAKEIDKCIVELKQMDLLPLEDGKWVSMNSGPVYLSKAEGIDIPSGINLRVISKGVTNIDRLHLFEALGTRSESVSLVRKKILGTYSRNRYPIIWLPFQTSKGHLEFLYLAQHLKGEDELSYKRLSVCVRDEQSGLVRPYKQCTYIVDEADPYGPWELFRKTEPGIGPGDGAEGYGAVFVNEEYFRSSPEKPFPQQLTWREWFQ